MSITISTTETPAPETYIGRLCNDVLHEELNPVCSGDWSGLKITDGMNMGSFTWDFKNFDLDSYQYELRRRILALECKNDDDVRTILDAFSQGVYPIATVVDHKLGHQVLFHFSKGRGKGDMCFHKIRIAAK